MNKADCQESINGILLVNKPQGLSSNAVLQKVKRLYHAKKAGHTGSLDPLATGMLPICFGEATKLCQYLLNADKAYLATGLLGIKTNTGDALGDIIGRTSIINVDILQLKTVIQQFIGSIQQTPPMFSALKHKGQPLYKLARAGITIERKVRNVTINSIDLLTFDGYSFSIKVSCSKGTYIRSLIEDIGEALGVHAHVTQLHRLYTAGFMTDRMYTLDDLMEQDKITHLNYLLPLEQAISHLPVIMLDTTDVLKLQQGKILTYQANLSNIGLVRLHDLQANFIGLAQLSVDGLLKVKRLMAY